MTQDFSGYAFCFYLYRSEHSFVVTVLTLRHVEELSDVTLSDAHEI